MIYKKQKYMQQVDNFKTEELPISKDSTNETITLKNNNQLEKTNNKAKAINIKRTNFIINPLRNELNNHIF